MKTLKGILFGITTLLAGSAFSTGILYVDRNFQGEHPTGHSWLSAFPTLQEALDAAPADGEIWVRSGVYKPEGDTHQASFKLLPGIALYGGFRGNETAREQRNPRANRTILSGDIGRVGSRTDNCHHIVTGAAESRIDGFILSAGHADGTDGGAVLIDSNAKNVSLANCTFENNHASRGGAIHASASGTTLSNCTFFSNTANLGGAILAEGNAEIKVMNCTFTSNFAQESGGAVAIRPSSKTEISHSWFLFNRTDGTGGAIDGRTQKNRELFLTMDQCEFKGNSAIQNGGGLFSQGHFSAQLTQCRFIENVSTQGAGAIAGKNSATISFMEGTLTRNQSAKDLPQIVIDTTTTKVPPANDVVLPKPVEKIVKKGQFAEIHLHTSPTSQRNLQALIEKSNYTVLAFGDLTNPDFITTYRSLEAASQDYSEKGIRFFYIHSYLTHPENNNYVQPILLAERFQHTFEAKKLLRTRIPWLCDEMDNSVAKALERGVNNLFIYNKEGVEKYAGNLSDMDRFRKTLTSVGGMIAAPTRADTFAAPEISPIKPPAERFMKRVKIRPPKDLFLPLKTTPSDSRKPFYVKLRVEASSELLETGNGRMYLGFHIDPLYLAKWNNLAMPLEYTIKIPRETAASPSKNRAKRVETRPTDSEPREFMIEVRKWDSTKPISVTVTYSILSGRSNRILEVSQQHMVHLKTDPFGGTVIGRQIPDERKKTKVTYSILLFKHFDADHDGMLSREEAPGHLQKKWDKADANTDGFVTEEEYRKLRP